MTLEGERVYKIIYTTHKNTQLMEHKLNSPRHRNDIKFIKIHAKNLAEYKDVMNVWIYHMIIDNKKLVK